ncbi:hypothetical protein AnigIFM60653_011613 [Aspergillus niger]|nr:hypothetical protein AnigIFM50267_004143 [Aspergillus niger]GLA01361.1 hypothetical protein AnigIFM60653_011613 [Aspergillus niger]
MYMALKRDRNDSSTSSSERLPLSDSSEDYHDESFDKDHFDDGSRYGDYPRRSHFQWSSLCFHLILASIYGAAFLAATYRSTSSIRHHDSKPEHLIASPLWEAVKIERKTINASIESENPFKGAPSEELDHAWHQLFINSNIRVTAEDLARINRTSVPLNDEKGGYYAIPEHCIDNLRQNIMCKADIALLTFTWDPTDRAPKPNFVVEHECANWDKVDKWAEEHRFDIFDETTLIHPTLGPSFPEEEYKATGRIPGHPDFHPNEYHGGHSKGT